MNPSLEASAKRCDQCASATINGVFTHEYGCPKTPRECKWCGQAFVPETHARHTFCDDSCWAAFNGFVFGVES